MSAPWLTWGMPKPVQATVCLSHVPYISICQHLVKNLSGGMGESTHVHVNVLALFITAVPVKAVH